MEAPIPKQETALSGLLAKNSEILVCPVCGGGLELSCSPISWFSCGEEVLQRLRNSAVVLAERLAGCQA